jgi:hypothetical protein
MVFEKGLDSYKFSNWYKDILSSFSLLTLLICNWTGCFYSTAVGGLMCYENPKNKITAVPANEEDFWGATFKVTQ